MTTQDQIKALAELDGWTFVPSHDVRGIAQPEYWFHENEEVAFCYKDSPANYLHSYDAIIPLIQKQDGEIKNLVEDYIEECQTMKTSFWYDATPSQLCEALLRATGKWKE